eukprot:550998_1
MAQQEQKKQTNAEIAKVFLDTHCPDTIYAENELQTYKKFEEKARKNMFLQSVRDGETEIALKLVFYELVNVNVFDGYGNTALHYSCYFNRLNLIDFILQCNDIDINQQNTSKATPLHLGCEMKHFEAVQKLIHANGYNININAVNSNNWTALHYACFVNINLINKSNDEEKLDENTLKTKINDEINMNLINLLVQNGCNVNTKNSSDKTAVELLPNDYLNETKKQLLQKLFS